MDYQPTKIPTNPQDLVYNSTPKKTVQLNELKDTVLLYIGGGPIHFRDTVELYALKELLVDKITSGRYSTIGLNQAHFINPTVFGSGSRFTAQNATEVNNATLTMLEGAIKWLKKGQKVWSLC